MHSKFSLAVLLATLLLCSGIAAQAASNPSSGSWKMNAAKSKFDPGPAPKSIVTKAEDDGTSYTIDSVTVNADGSESHSTFMAKFDGKDYPVTGAPFGDMISLKRVNDYTIDGTWKRNGKESATTHGVVPKDGKTRTVTFDGTDANGKKFHNVVVYDKQM